MRLALTLILTLTFAAGTADAHPKPQGSAVKIGLHKICTALGKCTDRPPKLDYGPGNLCTSANAGEVVTVYDKTLGAQVDWQCRCLNEVNCKWFRLGIRQSAFTAFWRAQPRNYVLDWMRRCPAIVCKGRLVRHYYPVYRGRALAEPAS